MAETDTLEERIAALEQQMGQGQQGQQALQPAIAPVTHLEERLSALEQRMQQQDEAAAQLDTRMDATVRRILDELRLQGQLGAPPGVAQPLTPAQAHEVPSPQAAQGGADKIYGDTATLREQQDETAKTQQREDELHQPHSSVSDKGDEAHQEQRHRARRHD